jgi:hypothetical protein
MASPIRATAMLLFAALPLLAQDKAGPSAHRKGPNGLEGWLVRKTVPAVKEQGPLPIELVIARNGHIIRRFSYKEYGPFLWNFLFLPEGRSIAVEYGPLNFVETCSRINIATGRSIEDVDCFQLPENAPDWATALAAAAQP